MPLDRDDDVMIRYGRVSRECAGEVLFRDASFFQLQLNMFCAWSVNEMITVGCTMAIRALCDRRHAIGSGAQFLFRLNVLTQGTIAVFALRAPMVVNRLSRRRHHCDKTFVA